MRDKYGTCTHCSATEDEVHRLGCATTIQGQQSARVFTGTAGGQSLGAGVGSAYGLQAAGRQVEWEQGEHVRFNRASERAAAPNMARFVPPDLGVVDRTIRLGELAIQADTPELKALLTGALRLLLNPAALVTGAPDA